MEDILTTPVTDLLEHLRGQHRQGEFAAHPPENGFTARGLHQNLIELRRLVGPWLVVRPQV